MTIANRRSPAGQPAQYVTPDKRASDLIGQSLIQTPLSAQPSNNVVQRVDTNSGDFAITPNGALLSNHNTRRAFLSIQNKSSLTVFINVGAAANDGNRGRGRQIDPGGFWEPESVPINSIYAWTPIGNAAISFMEGMQ